MSLGWVVAFGLRFGLINSLEQLLCDGAAKPKRWFGELSAFFLLFSSLFVTY